MSYAIQDVDGIGATTARALHELGIRTTSELLALSCTPEGRQTLSAKTGESEQQILSWSNHADLMRIAGIGPQFSGLLRVAGIDTVRELRTRNPSHLVTALEQINQLENLVTSLPAPSQVRRWVSEAAITQPVLSY